MNATEGNIPPAEEERIDVPIRVGDAVRLTKTGFRKLSKDTKPLQLVKIGWPNAFQVTRVLEHPERGLQISLGTCCNFMAKKNGKPFCIAHPAKYFEVIPAGEIPRGSKEPKEEKPRDNQPGDRLTSVHLPFVGEAAAVEYMNDIENPAIALRLFGQKVVLNGPVAKQVSKMAQDLGIL